MTPELIAEAIKTGEEKPAGLLAHLRLLFSPRHSLGSLRLLMMRSASSKNFVAAAVTPNVIAPVIQVMAPSIQQRGLEGAAPEIVNVEAEPGGRVRVLQGAPSSSESQ